MIMVPQTKDILPRMIVERERRKKR